MERTMEDKQNINKVHIKKVLESPGEVHKKVANQSNLELPSLSPTRSAGPPRIPIDVQIEYDPILDILNMHRKLRR
jgi:hypothetical protein